MTSLTSNKRRWLVRRRVRRRVRRSFSGGGSFSVGGFTLIELLTVIVIIAILVALLFPAIKTTILKAEMNQAKADTKAIENAIHSYKNEYGRLPTLSTDQGQASPDKVYTSAEAINIYNILRATSTTWSGTDYNPRRIAFLETPSRKGAIDGSGNFLDPWASPYLLVFDCNHDGRITGLTGVNTIYNNLAGPALVISFGPDRVSTNPATRTDDLVNYN